MVNFKKPTTFRLFPFSVSAIFCHYIGYNIFRAILLDTSHAATDLPRVEIDYILYIFTLVEIISPLFASVVFQLVGNKFQLIFTFSVIWMFVLAIFHGTITTSSAILVAIASSFIKVGLLSYGASEYVSKYSAELYVYFLFSYLSTILSELGSIYYVPPNADDQCESSCFGIEFMAMKTTISITFGILCTTIFYMSKFSFVYPGATLSRSRVSPIFVARKMIYILIIIAPFPIVWISQKHIVTRWPAIAYLTTPEILSYIFDRDYVPCVYLWCIVIYVSIFYVFFYKKYSKCLCSFPFIAIIIGCILMLFAAITTRKLKMETQPYTNKLMQPNLSLVMFCAESGFGYSYITNSSRLPNITMLPGQCNLTKLELDSPYEYIRFAEKLDPNKIRIDLTELNFQCKEGFINYYCLVEAISCFNPYPYYYNPSYTNYSCKMARSSFTTIERSKGGLPKVCVGCSVQKYFGTFTFYKLSRIDQKYVDDGIIYNFRCSLYWPPCLDFAPGIYRLRADLRTTLDNCNDAFHFEMGGIYFLAISSKAEYTDVISTTIVGPLQIPILRLLFPIIMMAGGRTLIEVTGLYIIYTQSHPMLRTVSIGCWMVTSRSGELFDAAYKDSGNDDILIELNNVAKLIACGAVFFLSAAVCAIRCFNKDWAPSVQLDIIGEDQGTNETEAVEDGEV